MTELARSREKDARWLISGANSLFHVITAYDSAHANRTKQLSM
jgi:hypothetical protein